MASFSIIFIEEDESKYFTATGDFLKVFRETVPNRPLPSSALYSAEASSSIVGRIYISSGEPSLHCFILWPCKVALEFFSFSFSFSDCCHILKYFSLYCD